MIFFHLIMQVINKQLCYESISYSLQRYHFNRTSHSLTHFPCVTWSFQYNFFVFLWLIKAILVLPTYYHSVKVLRNFTSSYKQDTVHSCYYGAVVRGVYRPPVTLLLSARSFCTQRSHSYIVTGYYSPGKMIFIIIKRVLNTIRCEYLIILEYNNHKDLLPINESLYELGLSGKVTNVP